MENLPFYLMFLVIGLVIGAKIVYNWMNAYFSWRLRNAQEMMASTLPYRLQQNSLPHARNQVKNMRPTNRKPQFVSVLGILLFLLLVALGYAAFNKKMQTYSSNNHQSSTQALAPSKTLAELAEPSPTLRWVSTKGEPISSGSGSAMHDQYFLQMGSFLEWEKALAKAEELEAYYNIRIVIGEDDLNYFKVLIGQFPSAAAAGEYRKQHLHLQQSFTRSGREIKQFHGRVKQKLEPKFRL